MIRTANRNFGNGLPDVLRGVMSAGGGTKLIVRSNITPEITVDLTQLAVPGKPADTAVQGQNALLMNFIKPEVEVTGLGVSKIMAPYGRPAAGMFTVVAVGAAIAATLGGLVAWRICRG